MTVFRSTLLILSALMCAVPVQKTYGGFRSLLSKTFGTELSDEEFHLTVYAHCFLVGAGFIENNTKGGLALSALLFGCQVVAFRDLPYYFYDRFQLTFNKNYRIRELLATTETENLKRVKQLMRWGVNPNHSYVEVSPFGRKRPFTLLTKACTRGKNSMVKMLLAYGADPNIIDQDGQFPLLIAAKNNSLPMVKMLLNHGADPCAIDINDKKVSEEMRSFLNYHTYHSRSDYKKTLSALAKSKKLPEDIELHFVNLLHGQKAAKDEAEKRKEKSRRESALRAIEEVGLE